MVFVTLYLRQWSGIVPKEMLTKGAARKCLPTFSEVTHEVSKMVCLFQGSFANLDNVTQVSPDLA